jgi:putative ABC transport system permease protein
MRSIFRNLAADAGLSVTIASTLTAAFAFLIASLSIVNGLLFHPYPYPALRQLLLVRDSTPREGAHQGRSIAVADFLDARQQIRAFSTLAGWRPQPFVITNGAAEPERVDAAAVTANFFSTLGVTPILGRGFPSDADTAGRDAVIILSRRLWNSRFAADPSIVGRDIGVNGRAVTVIGIIRDQECYPPGVDAWIPLVVPPAEMTERAAQRIAAIGRLKDTSTQAEAAGQLSSLSELLASRYPLTNRGRGFELLSLQREQYEFTAPLFLFVLAAALLVLLLASVNVSHLMVARTLHRAPDLSVRAMLGASRARIAGGSIAEVLVLTTTAVAAAAAVAGRVVDVIRASLPDGIGRWFAGWSSMEVNAAGTTAGAAVAVGVAFAMSCVVGLTSLAAARGSGSAARVTRRSTWSRRILVTSEVGLAAALLLGASVMMSGFARISAAFEALSPSRVLKFRLTLPDSRYPDSTRIAMFHDALLDRLAAIPDVERVALVRNEPASNVPNPIVAFQRDDAPALQPSEMPRIDVEVVSPAAFDTLRLQVLGGRALAESDGIDAARVAVISQTAARRFWPDRDPVGTTIRLGTDKQSIRIVGVVSDLTLNWYDPGTRPIVFLPDAQSPARTTSVLLRTRIEPMSLARAVRAAVARLDERQPLSELEPLTTTIADSLSPIRIIARVLLVGAALAAALAALGIYGVLAHWVGARQRELGIRFALGATGTMIGRLVLREALLTAAAGMIAGIGATFVLLRLSGGALLGVPSLDARALLIVLACATALTIAGSLGPARRAARVDVAELLRLE